MKAPALSSGAPSGGTPPTGRHMGLPGLCGLRTDALSDAAARAPSCGSRPWRACRPALPKRRGSPRASMLAARWSSPGPPSSSGKLAPAVSRCWLWWTGAGGWRLPTRWWASDCMRRRGSAYSSCSAKPTESSSEASSAWMQGFGAELADRSCCTVLGEPGRSPVPVLIELSIALRVRAEVPAAANDGRRRREVRRTALPSPRWTRALTASKPMSPGRYVPYVS